MLISNPSTPHGSLVSKIVARFHGYLDSIKYVLVNYNVARADLHAALKAPLAGLPISLISLKLLYTLIRPQVTPGKKSPTLLPLEDSDWVAVSAMVYKSCCSEVLEELTAIGALLINPCSDLVNASHANCMWSRLLHVDSFIFAPSPRASPGATDILVFSISNCRV